MNKARTVIGAHAFFFRDGAAFTVPAAGTCGRAAKPGAADPAWLDLGVSDWTLTPQNKTSDFMAPAPGARVLYDKITTAKGLKLKGKIMELQNLTWQLLLGTLALPASPAAGGQYNPLEGDPVVRGWLQLQQYNQANTLINTTDYFVALTLPGDVEFGENPVDVNVEADLLFSTLNTGTLA
ncbi:MAG: hypothetical protein HZC55_21075 [Verrucomicrobia bacterium]|nr:hypothetical protein [Verrucomicrobiota bacterium]